MQKNSIFFAIFCLSLGHTDLVTAKVVDRYSDAGRQMEAYKEFVNNKAFVSPNVQEKCARKNCSGLYQAIIGALVLAAERPSSQELDTIEEKLKNGSATLNDLVRSTNAIACYGEGVLVGDRIQVRESREVSMFGPHYDPFNRDPGACIQQMNSAISNIGQENKWTQETITQEQNYCHNKMVDFLKNALAAGK